jgi:hypothetical protein
MRPVTFNVSEPIYRRFLEEARKRDRKAAQLIREAMEYYLEAKLRGTGSLDSWEPLSLGTVGEDWADGSFRDDMLTDRYPG